MERASYICHRCKKNPANLCTVCDDCRDELIALKNKELQDAAGNLYSCSDCGKTITTEQMEVYGYAESLYFIHTACYRHDEMTGKAVMLTQPCPKLHTKP